MEAANPTLDLSSGTRRWWILFAAHLATVLVLGAVFGGFRFAWLAVTDFAVLFGAMGWFRFTGALVLGAALYAVFYHFYADVFFEWFSKRVSSRRLLEALGPFLGLVFVVALFSLDGTIRPFFLSGANFKIILTQTVIVAIGALGMTMIIVSGGIDLSVGSVVALCSVVGASLLVEGYRPLAVGCLTILVGGGIGLVNGTIISRFRMLPFIVTLGMMGIARGSAKWLAGNQVVNTAADASAAAINGLMALVEPTRFLPLPVGVWLAIRLALVMAIVMRQTVFGRHVFAIGSNEATARLCGVRVGLQKVIIYTGAGLFFGLAGLMQFSRLTLGDPSVAIGLELDIIAAVVIGGASLSGGSGSILGSMIGALIMAVLRNGSNQMGWPTYMQEIIIGAVIILAVGLDKLRQRRASQ